MKKSMKFFLIMVVMACLVAPAAMFAGGKQDDQAGADKPVHVRMVSWDSEITQGPLIDFLTETAVANNIEFEYQFVDNQQLDNVLNTQFAAGKGPDMLKVGAAFKGQVNAGYLLDLSDQPFIERYSETFLKNFTVGDGVYAVPSEAFFGGIYYNKKIFRENNIDVPASWDEFIAIADKLEGTEIRPFVVGAKSFAMPMWSMFGLLNSAFYSDPANLSFDNKFANGEAKAVDNWLEPLEKYYSQMLTNGLITPDMVGLEDEQAVNEFALGKSATYGGGNWHLDAILAKNPDIEVGMFPYPPIKAGDTGWMVGGSGNGYAINAESENIEACALLMDALSTPEGQQAMVAKIKAPVGLKGVKIDIGPTFDECSDAFEEGHVYFQWSHWMNSAQQIDTLTKELQLYYLGEKTLEEALTAFDAGNSSIVESMDN